jgi:hypothetical protein
MKLTNDQKRFVRDDRAWWRDHRISHARYQLRIAKTEKEKDFWRAILTMNSTDTK